MIGLPTADDVLAFWFGTAPLTDARAEWFKKSEAFDAEITVTRDGMSVPATSIMGLMMLGAAIGTSIMVEAKGAQAEEAMEALSLLVESKFDEE